MAQSILELADDVWNEIAPLNDVRRYPPGHLEEVAPGVRMSPGFGHAFLVEAGDGLVMYDTGPRETAQALHDGVRAWTDAPVTHGVYTHGHLDHVFGMIPFDQEAESTGRRRPVVVAHENVNARFDRYDLTKGYNTVINQRQFRNLDLVWPEYYRRPDTTYSGEHLLTVGDTEFQLRHALGETDDHTLGYLPDRKILFAGDLFLFVSPNAGNPQKVQRYPVEWAAALRWMAGLGAELMLPSHGVPVQGADRIREALENTAAYLESLVEQTLAVMNAGGRLSEAVATVRVPDELAAKPYLQPVYDEPEFVVRNVWRLYGGWYDGDPASLKPAQPAVLARALAELAGGAGRLADGAADAARSGDLRLAGHLAQLAVDAAPGDPALHRVRAEVFAARAKAEKSTMARGVFRWAAFESQTAAGDSLDEGLGRPAASI